MKYRKKPVVIEAYQLDLNDERGLVNIFDWIHGTDSSTIYGQAVGAIREQIAKHGGLPISTLEGVMVAQDKDYIIRGVQGEFYPCKPDIFEATYEKED